MLMIGLKTIGTALNTDNFIISISFGDDALEVNYIPAEFSYENVTEVRTLLLSEFESDPMLSNSVEHIQKLGDLIVQRGTELMKDAQLEAKRQEARDNLND